MIVSELNVIEYRDTLSCFKYNIHLVVTVAHINLLEKRFSMHRMGSHYNKEIFLHVAVIGMAITEAILAAGVVAAVKLTT